MTYIWVCLLQVNWSWFRANMTWKAFCSHAFLYHKLLCCKDLVASMNMKSSLLYCGQPTTTKTRWIGKRRGWAEIQERRSKHVIAKWSLVAHRACTVIGYIIWPDLTLTFLSIADNIPEDLRDPFYTDQYDQEHIKPPVIRLLLSCELYCRVCSLILKTEQAASLQSHLSVIQALSRKGIYVVESDDTPVTDGDLSCMPIKMVSWWICQATCIKVS